jgi:O-succinylbenzoate synthase
MQAQDSLTDGQFQTDTSMALAWDVSAEELLKDARFCAGRQPGAVVCQANLDMSIGPACTEEDLAARRCMADSISNKLKNTYSRSRPST